MNRYLVWDELNGERETAEEIHATSPEEAAGKYTESDVDGLTDGLYARAPQPIAVENSRGSRWVYEVRADYEVTFSASLVRGRAAL